MQSYSHDVHHYTIMCILLNIIYIHLILILRLVNKFVVDSFDVLISAYLSGYDGQFSFADIGQGMVTKLSKIA